MVYRDENNLVTHSGVVSHITPDGVFVDAKLGMLALTRSKVEETSGVYGSNIEFYHTNRPDGRFLASFGEEGSESPQWPPDPGR